METSSPLFAMCTEILEYSTMERQLALADYFSFEIKILMKDLSFRGLINKDDILSTAQRRSLPRVTSERQCNGFSALLIGFKQCYKLLSPLLYYQSEDRVKVKPVVVVQLGRSQRSIMTYFLDRSSWRAAMMLLT